MRLFTGRVPQRLAELVDRRQPQLWDGSADSPAGQWAILSPTAADELAVHVSIAGEEPHQWWLLVRNADGADLIWYPDEATVEDAWSTLQDMHLQWINGTEA